MNSKTYSSFWLSLIVVSVILTNVHCSISDNEALDEGEPVLCTEEFRTVTVRVLGGEVSNFITIRASTGDTVSRRMPNETINQKALPVLTDAYQPLLEGKKERFLFYAYSKENQSVSGAFVIEADRCHISLVDGPSTIRLF